MTFTCTKCSTNKPLSDFYKKKNARGHDTRCKPCVNDVHRAWVAANPDKRNATNKKYRDANPRNERAKWLWRKYKITEEQYDELLAAQDYKCGSCKKEQEGMNFAVDHDHACCAGDTSCGKCIRGLLCGKCNKGIGLLGDNLEGVLAAAEYLRGTM